MRTSRFAGLILVFVSLLTQHATAAPQTTALQRLNDSFHAMYKSTRDGSFKATTPVLLAFSNDKMVLIHQGVRREAPCVPEDVSTLKTFAHVPLAVYAALLPETARPLSSDGHKLLQEFAAHLAAAPGDWQHLGISADQKARQQQILQASLVMCNDVLARGRVTQAQLDAFAHSMRPLVYANVGEAARASIDALHRQTMAWRAQLGEAAWQQLHVVVLGSHMARQGEMTLQYFMHVMHQTHEGARVIFAEGIWDEGRALELLATHLLDGAASRGFFDDSSRLHRDVMADAAQDYLNLIGTDLPPPKAP